MIGFAQTPRTPWPAAGHRVRAHRPWRARMATRAVGALEVAGREDHLKLVGSLSPAALAHPPPVGLGSPGLLVLRAAGDGDPGGLLDHCAVLACDRCGHLQARLAEVAVGSQGRM